MNPSFADQMLALPAFIGYVIAKNWGPALADVAVLGASVPLAVLLVSGLDRIVRAANAWVGRRLQGRRDRRVCERYEPVFDDGQPMLIDAGPAPTLELPEIYDINRMPPRPAPRHGTTRRPPRSPIRQRLLDRARRTTNRTKH